MAFIGHHQPPPPPGSGYPPTLPDWMASSRLSSLLRSSTPLRVTSSQRVALLQAEDSSPGRAPPQPGGSTCAHTLTAHLLQPVASLWSYSSPFLHCLHATPSTSCLLQQFFLLFLLSFFFSSSSGFYSLAYYKPAIIFPSLKPNQNQKPCVHLPYSLPLIFLVPFAAKLFKGLSIQFLISPCPLSFPKISEL